MNKENNIYTEDIIVIILIRDADCFANRLPSEAFNSNFVKN